MLGIRTTLGLSQVAMVKKLGISKSALCEVEKGHTLVSPEAAVRYAKKAGFSITVALEGPVCKINLENLTSKNASELKMLHD